MTYPVLAFAAQFTLGGAWTALSSRLLDFDHVSGRQYEIDGAEAGEGSALFDNPDAALSPLNASSPYAGSLLPYRPCRAVTAWNATTLDGTGNFINPSNAAYLDAPLAVTDANFGAGVGHWGGSFANIATSTVVAQAGANSLLVTALGGGVSQALLTIPTLPGKPTVVSGYAYIPAAGGVTGVRIGANGANGTSTAVTASWVRLSYAFTPTSWSTVLRLESTASATAGQVFYIDSLQVELGTVPSPFSIVGPALNPTFAGYVERWPEAWGDNPRVSSLKATLVDSLAFTGPNKFGFGAYALDVLSDAPLRYWPLSDPAGSASCADVSGNAGDPLTLVTYQPGSPGLVYSALGVTQSLGGDDNIGLQLTNPSPNGYFAPFPAIGHSPAVAPYWSETGYACPTVATNNYTVECVLVPTASNNGNGVQLFDWADSTGALLFQLDINTLSHPSASISGVGLTTGTMDVSGPSVLHLLATVSGTTFTLYVNGVVAITVTDPAMPVGFGNYFMLARGIDGWAGHVALYDKVLSPARIASHAAGIASCYAGDTTAARFSRLLSWAGFIGGSSVPAPAGAITTMTAAAGLSSATFADALKRVVDTENGQMYVDGYGRLTLLPRSARYTTSTPAWVLGENTAAGQVPYLDDVSPTIDPTLIYNDVTFTRDGGSAARAVDAASQNAYGTRTFDRTVYTQSDLETSDGANFMLARYKDPTPRFAAVTVDGMVTAAGLGFVLGVNLGDRVTLNRVLSNGVTWTADYFVDHLDRVLTPGSVAKVTVQLSPASLYQGWVLDDAVNSVLGTTTIPVY